MCEVFCGMVTNGVQRGPAKVRDEAMRIQIPKEGARETGRVGVVS